VSFRDNRAAATEDVPVEHKESVDSIKNYEIPLSIRGNKTALQLELFSLSGTNRALYSKPLRQH
jgi:hypothetical protein